MQTLGSVTLVSVIRLFNINLDTSVLKTLDSSFGVRIKVV